MAGPGTTGLIQEKSMQIVYIKRHQEFERKKEKIIFSGNILPADLTYLCW